MARELTNVKITHVSYVDKGANQKKFFLTKAQDRPNIQKQIKILTKADDAQHLVYGVVYEPNVADAHGDIMTSAEIEKAAHGFMKDARNIDLQHNFEEGYGDVVESYIAPQDFEIGGEAITKGSWVMATKASDEVWEAIQKGEITGYSMAGIAETVEKQSEPSQEMRGFFATMKAFFTGEKIEKGAVKDKYERNRKSREFWAAQDALNSILFRWDQWDSGMETDSEKIKEALQDFVTIAEQVLVSDDIMKAIGQPPAEIQKAGKKISTANMGHIRTAHEALGKLIEQEEESDVKKEEIEKLVADGVAKALEPITKKLESVEKTEPTTDPVELKAEDVAKMVTDAVEKAVAPVTERLDAVEKARGISKQADGDPDPNQEPIKKHYLAGVL
ncbi:XkdF-like putative serine protease domain-containing protein [Desulforamulus aquiferis]|uniref:XkdF-like putative serine protease domain-containing protein n=1 Tax=Desulforamulus aquiferis TaxID=1397668 RepID=A0AAW7ZD22_9FIRM|nr:XkdF-like putative serine protease domain-containing protein [Desulforamulus aquiferis]MDO7787134.1 XkdF-like putative serine protease domain-containing protein [Desulforamulus aquiferis]